MGVCVRGSPLKLRHRLDREPRLVSLARIAFRFGEGFVAQHRHNLVGGASRLGQAPASCLAKAVRLSFERKPRGRHRVTDPLAEAIDRERLTVLGIDNGHVVAVGDGENGEQVSVQRNRELASGLLLHNPNGTLTHIGPRHAVHVASALAGIKHKRERETLLGAGRPVLLESFDLSIRP